VFTHGFAFKVTNKGIEGLLKGKRVRLITSAGMDEQSLKEMNIFESLKITQDQGVFEFCGMETIDHIYITESPQLSHEQKEDIINRILHTIKKNSLSVKNRGNMLNKRTPLSTGR